MSATEPWNHFLTFPLHIRVHLSLNLPICACCPCIYLLICVSLISIILEDFFLFHREITPDEHVAAVKLQKQWRGFYVRKVKNSRAPGTEENVKVQEVLQKAWSVIEPNAEQHGLTLFRLVFSIQIIKSETHTVAWESVIETIETCCTCSAIFFI